MTTINNIIFSSNLKPANGLPMYKHAIKVVNFDNSILQYPLLCSALANAIIEANVFCNPEFFSDVVKFQNMFGFHDLDILHNRCTCIISSYHLKQKAPTK